MKKESYRRQNVSLAKLYGKSIVLTLPFLPLIVVYFALDPDMIIGKYKRFDQAEVFLNEGYVGWQNYLNNRDSIPFNSFIVGNSCTMAFRTEEWEKYLTDNSKAVRFFENGESFAGVCQKLKALDENDAKIDNLLVVLDTKSFSVTIPSQNINRIFSYESAGISHAQFILRNLQAFLIPQKCFPYLTYKVTGKFSPNMEAIIVENGPIREPYTNNFLNPREQEIERDGENYWIKHQDEFHKKERSPGQTEERVIFKSQRILMQELKNICSKHSTNLTLIISPDFYQKKMHQKDLEQLQEFFGYDNVFDFTGVNQFTEDYHHYYEPGHYRPILGAKLLKHIYNQSDINRKREEYNSNIDHSALSLPTEIIQGNEKKKQINDKLIQREKQ